jgi:hypothetical protein
MILTLLCGAGGALAGWTAGGVVMRRVLGARRRRRNAELRAEMRWLEAEARKVRLTPYPRRCAR